MKARDRSQELGQRLWLDNIPRGLLIDGTRQRYIDALSGTSFTCNPTILDPAIRNASRYDAAIRQRAVARESGEAPFFAPALEDVIRPASRGASGGPACSWG